jgi:hypothetical protein
MNKRLMAALAAGALGGALVLSGCAAGDQEPAASPTAEDHAGHGSDAGEGEVTMEHPMDGGPAPEGITSDPDPTYPVGSEVTLSADHMEGMDGARARIAGAYTTYTYSVNYTPTSGGAPLKDHRWVVQEELEDAGDQRLPEGAEVVLRAEHMEGMNGAKATIASSTDETVYMVDYEADGMTMTNHKWVVESELRPVS